MYSWRISFPSSIRPQICSSNVFLIYFNVFLQTGDIHQRGNSLYASILLSRSTGQVSNAVPGFLILFVTERRASPYTSAFSSLPHNPVVSYPKYRSHWGRCSAFELHFTLSNTNLPFIWCQEVMEHSGRIWDKINWMRTHAFLSDFTCFIFFCLFRWFRLSLSCEPSGLGLVERTFRAVSFNSVSWDTL